MSSRKNGLGAAELLVVLALIGVAAAVALPAAEQLRRSGRLRAAARELAVELHGLRFKSVASNRGHGMYFRRDGSGWYWSEVRDENGNGLLTAEIRAGIDRIVSGPHRLERRIAGVRPGFPGPGPYPRIPPARGAIANTSDPVQFGRSDIIAFSPLGTASSGTVYLCDDAGGLVGVVLFGPSSRIRVWRWVEREHRWRL